ncbi:unnamed protein product [Prunus armeniaca]|uniref:Uncharacterized protein n=1 Tax=Prunus armeniaca TaxID=36596 RepID=A0A6J5XWC4_PRUAR|nr:unnamed protein product [Prunus armeniaca]
MHILMILEELNGKDFHQGGIITLVSGGGLVPENAFNGSALEDLLNAGVLGLKSLMCPSGISVFLMTNASHIKGLSVLAKYRRPSLVHAEKQLDLERDLGIEGGTFLFDVSQDLATFTNCYKETSLKVFLHENCFPSASKPGKWLAAIRDLLNLTKDTTIGAPAEGAHLHSVHLSDSSSSLDLINEVFYTYVDAKGGGDSVNLETGPHYLAFTAEEIRDGDTCSPPIHDAPNKEKL